MPVRQCVGALTLMLGDTCALGSVGATVEVAVLVVVAVGVSDGQGVLVAVGNTVGNGEGVTPRSKLEAAVPLGVGVLASSPKTAP